MQQWALQRARLEEEIIRRQEASRFAAPSARGAPVAALARGGNDGDEGYFDDDDDPSSVPGTGGYLSAQAQGYLSPYGGFTMDKVQGFASLPSNKGAIAAMHHF